MAASWFGAASAHRDLASEDVTCLSSMKVIDNILSDAEAQAVITDLEVQRSGSARRTPQVGAELKKAGGTALQRCGSAGASGITQAYPRSRGPCGSGEAAGKP